MLNQEMCGLSSWVQINPAPARQGITCLPVASITGITCQPVTGDNMDIDRLVDEFTDAMYEYRMAVERTYRGQDGMDPRERSEAHAKVVKLYKDALLRIPR